MASHTREKSCECDYIKNDNSSDVFWKKRNHTNVIILVQYFQVIIAWIFPILYIFSYNGDHSVQNRLILSMESLLNRSIWPSKSAMQLHPRYGYLWAPRLCESDERRPELAGSQLDNFLRYCPRRHFDDSCR